MFREVLGLILYGSGMKGAFSMTDGNAGQTNPRRNFGSSTLAVHKARLQSRLRTYLASFKRKSFFWPKEQSTRCMLRVGNMGSTRRRENSTLFKVEPLVHPGKNNKNKLAASPRISVHGVRRAEFNSHSTLKFGGGPWAMSHLSGY